ncbi:MAG: amylo-alpha-1,6-glucosidase [Acidobacteriota bacterium]|nr:amylo-alpha-1,6-glucosidase [Acidobacteriota bacterium]
MTPFPREWLVTNGLGGYASGTVDGPLRRRYHGLLIASLPNLGRTVLLTQVRESLQTSASESRAIDESNLEDFGLVDGLPRWRYLLDGVVIEKRIVMPYQHNTVHVSYRCVSGAVGPLSLQLRPMIGFRGHEIAVTQTLKTGYALGVRGPQLDIAADSMAGVSLRLLLHAPGAAFVLEHLAIDDVHYLIEEARGYEASGGLWSPGYYATTLEGDAPVTLTASSEMWDVARDDGPERSEAAELERRQDLLTVAGAAVGDPDYARLVLAADQFVITPLTRLAHEARGVKARTIIAGYHWFTDWGRDTMISLEGLALVTGRHAEAREILRTFAGAERDGLIPNYFPEGDSEGVYHTADATLWFFHAISRYSAHTGDAGLVTELLPVLRRIVDAHMRGTRFGIGVDASDGLLSQGEEGYQLTWMDAKVDGWVVTPRRGKAVEINALWYNALRLMQGWLDECGEPVEAARLRDTADRVRASFNARFWSDELGHLYDVVDVRDATGGNDGTCRPNQIFAISLEHPVLDEQRWRAVVDVVEARLLTPVGLRSLAPGHPDYKPQYFGDLRTRDAAYHQGTVWGWLIGPAVDAWLKTHAGDASRARGLLDGLIAHLDEAGTGSISEVFDAEPPYAPRGCIAQAWSVAEVLRCLWKISGARTTSPARR